MDSTTSQLSGYSLQDAIPHYKIRKLHLHGNSVVQSPVDVNDFVRCELEKVISRSNKQVQTFTSIVKKYRPVIMPKVRDIFDDCINDKTKYEVDKDNDYGVFGWCTIPSKTMVDMEYNERALIVPSSYGCHNRIGGKNFLQMDPDLEGIYRKWVRDVDEDEPTNIGHIEPNVKDTWAYMYA